MKEPPQADRSGLSGIGGSIISILLNTSIYTAACALALCVGAEKLMLGHLPPLFSPLHYLIIGSTMIEYNVHHLFNLPRDGKSWSPWAIPIHWIISIVGVVLCLIALPHLSMNVLIGCGALGILSLAYSTPLLPFRYKQRLKDYGLLKIHILTGVWVLVGTVLPGLYWGIPYREYCLETVVRFLFIFPLCIAFDIRDAKPDLERGINTIPNTLGLNAAYRAVDLTLMAFIIWGTIRCIRRDSYKEMIVYGITAVAAHFAIRLSKRNPHPYIYLVLVDGVMLLYGVLQCVI
jgi:4-hydroxybenzoate polyprenyltransferase